MNEMKKMSINLSDKIKVLSFISIIMVIYIHMYYTEGENMYILNRIETFLGGSICSIAVPLFYIISGYLFFLKAHDIHSIFTKMKKRVKTLLIPYLLANIFTFIFYVILNILTLYNSTLDKVVNFKVLETFDNGFLQVFLDIFWGPIAFQLWFVRDLMLIILISPLIYICLKRLVKSKNGLVLLCIIEAFLFFIHASALFWFVLGGIFSLTPLVYLKDLSRWKKTGILLSILFLSLCFTNTLQLLPKSLISIIPLIGVPTIWILYDNLVKGKILCTNEIIAELCNYTFFIYLIHEPTLNIFKKLPLLFNRSETTLIISYLIIPLLFTFFAIILGRIFKKHLPKMYNIYTGGR